MNIDTFLKIGHSHTICQDYIISGDNPFPYIILADGCSQSKDSDIGARLLCHTALNYLKQCWEDPDKINASEMGERIILDAEFALKIHFNTSVDALDATLIVAYKYKGEYKILMYGDGCVWFVGKTGEIDYYNLSYQPNTPYYLRYLIRGKNDYLKSNVSRFIDTPHGKLDTKEDSLKPFELTFNENEIQLVMIASDGVDSFMFKEEAMYKSLYLDLLSNGKRSTPFLKSKEFSFKKVCEDFTDFKLLKGPFLSRRVKKVMKEYLKLGFVNDDDLSIGCFYED
jgi:serine/threonine protein phosphatase PrpC